uniref:Uncharacterized protein n=1 Tax=Lepeophtheirus salmonis TaxID=72036 RepID=A0A0K2UBL7_LEPSM
MSFLNTFSLRLSTIANPSVLHKSYLLTM